MKLGSAVGNKTDTVAPAGKVVAGWPSTPRSSPATRTVPAAALAVAATRTALLASLVGQIVAASVDIAGRIAAAPETTLAPIPAVAATLVVAATLAVATIPAVACLLAALLPVAGKKPAVSPEMVRWFAVGTTTGRPVDGLAREARVRDQVAATGTRSRVATLVLYQAYPWVQHR